jgi:hypothetical protein
MSTRNAIQPVVYVLLVERTDQLHDALLLDLTTESLVTAPAVGEVFDLAEWCSLDEELHLDPACCLWVNRSRREVFSDGGNVVVRQVLGVSQGESPRDPVAEFEREAERMRHRAEFFAEVAGELVPAVARRILDACAEAIVTRLSTEPARGVDEDALSAWQEAAGILQADDHLLRETMISELQGLADEATRGLSVSDRVAVWLHTARGEADADADLWDSEDLRHFDPLTAYRGALDDAHERIVRQVLGKLQDEVVER